METIVDGRDTVTNDEQPKKALSPMLVTLDGILMLVRDVQNSNAQLPMEVIVGSTSTANDPLTLGILGFPPR